MRTDPSILPQRATTDAGPATRATRAGLLTFAPAVARRGLELSLGSRDPTLHVFVAADPALRVEGEIVEHAVEIVRSQPTAHDIVYVHDFDNPAAPMPLVLPAGRGPVLADAMSAVLDRLEDRIPAVARAAEFKRTQSRLASDLEKKNRAALRELEGRAKSYGFGIRSVQGGGVQPFPILHGKPVSPEQFSALDESTRRRLEESEAKLAREVERAAERVKAQSARFDAVRETAFSKGAAEVIDEALGDVLRMFASLGDPERRWLEQVRRALKDDWQDLVAVDHTPSGEAPSDEAELERDYRGDRFRVNVLVAHHAGAPPPVVYDTNPTFAGLFGRIEREAHYGSLVTDFTRIRPGSIHKASGGVLVLRAADVLADPLVWERLKQVLRQGSVAVEDSLGPLGIHATSLHPAAVPVSARVVLVGSPDFYDSLMETDPDFAGLFRVKAELDATVERSRENLIALDAHLMGVAAERSWGPFDRPARARLLDLATRLSGDREKLSLWLSPVEEAMAFSTSAGRAAGPDDVTAAWEDRRQRAGSAERHLRESTLRGEVALDSSGWRVGVVNGLSVFSSGDVEFGIPMRITAVVGIGREGIVDVEREAQLGGSIHTKGVAILRGYLGRLFGQERPLSLRAQLAFEQSYGEIDGDSASSSELFAVLSALAEVEIDQGVAVTGSVNQLGEMQAIGGVCAKIEGFFDLCRARGLTGTQGVVIPSANRPHLTLRDDVTDAIARGQFHVYAVDWASQGIEVLTGLPSGERDGSGRFAAGSVFGRVERRIIEMAERLREAEGHTAPEAGEPPDDGGHADPRSVATSLRRSRRRPA